MDKQAEAEFNRRFELVKTACAARLKEHSPELADEECLKIAHDAVVAQLELEQQASK